VFAGTLRFPDNVIALFDCGTAMTERDELEAIGSEGSLFLDDPWHCNVPVIELRRDGKAERIEIELVDSYRLELENLSDAIRGEGELLLGRDDAVGQARALEALHESATNGRPVSL
jgi:predicted dehydrogenase